MNKSLEERLNKIYEEFGDDCNQGGDMCRGNMFVRQTAKFIDSNIPQLLKSYVDSLESLKAPVVKYQVSTVIAFSTQGLWGEVKDKLNSVVAERVGVLENTVDKLNSITEELIGCGTTFAKDFCKELPGIYNHYSTGKLDAKGIMNVLNIVEENKELIKELSKIAESGYTQGQYHYSEIWERGIAGQLLENLLKENPKQLPNYLKSLIANAEKLNKFQPICDKLGGNESHCVSDAIVMSLKGICLDSETTSDYLDICYAIATQLKSRDNLRDFNDKVYTSNTKMGKEGVAKQFKTYFDCVNDVYSKLESDLSKKVVTACLSKYIDNEKLLSQTAEKLKKTGHNLDKISKKFENDKDVHYVFIPEFKYLLNGLGKYTEPFLTHLKPDFDKADFSGMLSTFYESSYGMSKESISYMLTDTNLAIENSEDADKMFKLVDMLSIAHCLDAKHVWPENKEKMNVSEANSYLMNRNIEKIKEKFKFSEETSRKIVELKNAKDFIKNLNTIQKKTGMSPAEFMELFGGSELGMEGSKEKRIAYHTIERLTSAYNNFNKKYTILPCSMTDSNIGIEEANKLLYKQGIELLAEIQSGEIEFKLEDSDVNSYVEKKKELTQRLKQLFSEGKKEEANMLIANKKTLEKEITEVKKAKIAKELEVYEIKPGAEPGMDNLKECLSQLSQHNLEGKTQERAKYIASNLVITENSIDSNVIDISVWDKTIFDIPTYNEYHCCGFVGYSGKEGETYAYMANKSVQLIDIKVGSKKAKAITAATKDHSGKPVLLVDSVESGTHMLSRQDVVKTAASALEDYAREAGFERILYSTRAGNNAPNEFLNNLKKLGYKKGSRKLNLMTEGPQVYLETAVSNADGKVAGLRAIGYIKELK